jgi:predicted hydrolase (HD superfamily)
MIKSRFDAIKLVNKWIEADSLKNHCLAVAVSMETYVEKYIANGTIDTTPPAYPTADETKEKWWICGLLHDFDWEKHPTMEQHPSEGVKVLRENGVDEEICQAILGHSNHTGVKRESQMAKTLYAVDELSGLVVALARVRPNRFEGMTASSVKKVMKKKEFAAAINREDIKQGILELGVNEDEHFELVIKALSKIRVELGL